MSRRGALAATTIVPLALAIGLAIAVALSAVTGLLRPERLASDRDDERAVAAALR